MPWVDFDDYEHEAGECLRGPYAHYTEPRWCGHPLCMFESRGGDPEALALLEKRTPGRYRLTIVGDGQLENDLRGEADRFGDAVRFCGHVPNGPELFKLYRASDIFVHVARTEGLPQVLTEAQAAGLPIVATDVGGVRAGLGGGAEALLVPPNDPEALAAAIVRLASDGDLRAGFRKLGIARARTLTLERQAATLATFISGYEASEPGDAAKHRHPG